MLRLLLIAVLVISPAADVKFKIGQTYKGGKIFFIDKTARHGLIAAPKDFPEMADWNKAIQLCKNYKGDGYSDWHLPTKDELNLLYEKKDLIGGFAPSYYWSSTEADSKNAWYQVFFNGNQYGSFKTYTGKVRAVRNF